jgi:hypothetical protein
MDKRHAGEQEALKLDHEQRRAEERSAMAKFTASHNERHVNDAPDIRGAADAKFELARAERAETFEKKLANEQAGLDQRQASERSQAERSVSTPSVEPAKTTTSQPTLDR